MVKERHHHGDQGGFLTAMQASCAGEDAPGLADQIPSDPALNGAVNEILHRGRHVSESSGRPNEKAITIFEIGGLGIGWTLRWDCWLGGLVIGRDTRHCAQDGLAPIDRLHPLAACLCKLLGRAVPAVEENQDAGRGQGNRTHRP